MNKIFQDIINRQEKPNLTTEAYDHDDLVLLNDYTKNMSAGLFNPGDVMS